MISPYTQEAGAPSFMPPPGLAEMLKQRNQQSQKDAESVGKGAGALGAGVMGAVQGSSSPSTFGAGTSAASGGAQGFLANFANSYNGGGNGSTGMAGMVNPGGGGNGAPTGGMNVKQLQLAGKTADAFRDQMASQTPTTGDDDPKVLGATDDEWDTLGAADKWAKVQGFVQGQVQSQVNSKLQDYAAQARERDAQTQATQDAGTFLKHYLTAPGTMADSAPDPESGEASQVERPTTAMERFAYAGSQMPNNWDAGRATPQIINSLTKMAAMTNGGGAPTPYVSPTGNNYVRLGNTLLPDRTAQDLSSVQPPDGYAYAADGKGGYKTVKLPAPRPIPDSFNKAMDTATSDIADAQNDIGSGDATKAARGQRNLKAAQQRGKATVDRYFTNGYFDSDQRDAHYSELAINTPSAAAPAPPAAGKQITPALAGQFLQQAGGDKNKARALATQAGYTF